MKVGDRRPVLRVVLGYKGQPSPDTNPLAGATGVTLRMVNKATGEMKISDGVGLIESVQQKIVSYDWAAGDTDQAGEFEAWFRVAYGSGIVQSFPSCDGFCIHIEAAG